MRADMRTHEVCVQSDSRPADGRLDQWWPRLALPARFALREMRGGLRGFYVLIACIGLGVMAIAGVSSVASGLANGLAREGRVILGGDLSFSLSLREASADERGFLQRQATAQHGALSVAATMRAMARAPDGRAALVELKAVDGSYPLYGGVALEPQQPLPELLARRNGAFGAAADPTLLARLDLASGARLGLGSATIDIRAVINSEPDKLAGGLGFGPRLLVSEEALRASGLVQPGSVVRWHYRLRLPGNDEDDALAHAVTAAAQAQLPEAGWQIRSRVNASPALVQNVERFTQYLTLVGLTALLIGGVGVANAVRAHIDRRWDVIATLRSLGATASRIFAIYLFQVMALAALGALPGLLVAAALPFAIAWFFSGLLPLPFEPALHPAALALALLYGLLTTLAFAVWPLGRAQDVSAATLFRDEVGERARRPPARHILLALATMAGLAAVAVGFAHDRRIAAIFVVAAAGVFVLLRLMSALLVLVARRIPTPRAPVFRLALANIHRPGALTPSVVLSLGLGLTLLITVALIDGNLRRQFLAALPEHAPSFYFLDIPASDAEKFSAFIRSKAPRAALREVPMLRGRILAARGIQAEDLHPSPDTAWALQSDRGITYADEVPAGSRLVAGRWWTAHYDGPPLVSFEQRVADGLGLKIGDTVTVNVLGRNLNATVANLRAVDWQSLGMNFVMVFSPNTFRGAPNTHIATLTYPGGGNSGEEVALLRAVADTFPGVTALRVRELLETVGQTVTNLALAIRAASALTLVVAVLVLAGALAAGHRRRVYEAVILKVVGATRIRLLSAYLIEYVVLGVASAMLAAAAGSGAAAYVLARVMHLPFVWLPGPLLVCASGAIVGMLVLGLIGTFRALGERPATVLRNL
jgi:putative ABC transport system permease protein